MKEHKKEKKKIEDRLDELDLGKVLEKKWKKKRILVGAIITVAIIVFAALVTLNHFYGNKGYIRADVKVSSSSKLYSNSKPENVEDIGEGALFILYVEGIKRDDFLAEYEVTEITINGEKTDIDKLTYRVKSKNGAEKTNQHYSNLFEKRRNFIFTKTERIKILKEFDEFGDSVNAALSKVISAKRADMLEVNLKAMQIGAEN